MEPIVWRQQKSIWMILIGLGMLILGVVGSQILGDSSSAGMAMLVVMAIGLSVFLRQAFRMLENLRLVATDRSLRLFGWRKKPRFECNPSVIKDNNWGIWQPGGGLASTAIESENDIAHSLILTGEGNSWMSLEGFPIGDILKWIRSSGGVIPMFIAEWNSDEGKKEHQLVFDRTGFVGSAFGATIRVASPNVGREHLRWDYTKSGHNHFLALTLLSMRDRLSIS